MIAAERSGIDLVGIQDHPYQRRFLDTFALIADLLARTSRLRFFPDVASLPMRPPAMLAKAAASLDVMSGGRFELGIGAGNFWDAVVGMGGPRREPGERGAALEEAIDIIRAALDVDPERRVVRGNGPFYPVPGYPAGPPRPITWRSGSAPWRRARWSSSDARPTAGSRAVASHKSTRLPASLPGWTTPLLPPDAIREPSGAS